MAFLAPLPHKCSIAEADGRLPALAQISRAPRPSPPTCRTWPRPGPPPPSGLGTPQSRSPSAPCGISARPIQQAGRTNGFFPPIKLLHLNPGTLNPRISQIAHNLLKSTSKPDCSVLHKPRPPRLNRFDRIVLQQTPSWPTRSGTAATSTGPGARRCLRKFKFS